MLLANSQYRRCGLGLWCLTPLFYFSYIVAVSFIGGENNSTQRKLPTGHKYGIRTHNISGDRHCFTGTCSYKANYHTITTTTSPAIFGKYSYWHESGKTLNSDSTHHFFGNACTCTLRFFQFPSCCLILSVYILMSFDFSFGRLFGVR